MKEKITYEDHVKVMEEIIEKNIPSNFFIDDLLICNKLPFVDIYHKYSFKTKNKYIEIIQSKLIKEQAGLILKKKMERDLNQKLDFNILCYFELMKESFLYIFKRHYFVLKVEIFSNEI